MCKGLRRLLLFMLMISRLWFYLPLMPLQWLFTKRMGGQVCMIDSSQYPYQTQGKTREPTWLRYTLIGIEWRFVANASDSADIGVLWSLKIWLAVVCIALTDDEALSAIAYLDYGADCGARLIRWLGLPLAWLLTRFDFKGKHSHHAARSAIFGVAGGRRLYVSRHYHANTLVWRGWLEYFGFQVILPFPVSCLPPCLWLSICGAWRFHWCSRRVAVKSKRH